MGDKMEAKNIKMMHLIVTIVKIMQVLLLLLIVGSIIGFVGGIILRVSPDLVAFTFEESHLISYLNTKIFPALGALIILALMILVILELLKRVVSELAKGSFLPSLPALLKKLLIGELIYAGMRVVIDLQPFDIEDELISILPSGGNYIELFICMVVTYVAYVTIKQLVKEE